MGKWVGFLVGFAIAMTLVLTVVRPAMSGREPAPQIAGNTDTATHSPPVLHRQGRQDDLGQVLHTSIKEDASESPGERNARVVEPAPAMPVIEQTPVASESTAIVPAVVAAVVADQDPVTATDSRTTNSASPAQRPSDSDLAVEEIVTTPPPVAARTPADITTAAPPVDPPSAEAELAQTVDQAKQWYAFWQPFGSEISARGFSRRLERLTGLDYRVVRVDAGEYHVAFGYDGEQSRMANLEAIEAATGLQLGGQSL